MVDTNIFSNLVSGEIRLESLPPDGEFWSTPVQWAELNDARGDRRSQLLSKFKEIVDSKAIVPAAFSFDVRGAGFDEGEWRNDTSVYDALKTDLDEAWKRLPTKKKKRKKKGNNAKDALIAEAAMLRDFTLLTSDSDLAEAAKKNRIKVSYVKAAPVRP